MSERKHPKQINFKPTEIDEERFRLTRLKLNEQEEYRKVPNAEAMRYCILKGYESLYPKVS